MSHCGCQKQAKDMEHRHQQHGLAIGMKSAANVWAHLSHPRARWILFLRPKKLQLVNLCPVTSQESQWIVAIKLCVKLPRNPCEKVPKLSKRMSAPPLVCTFDCPTRRSSREVSFTGLLIGSDFHPDTCTHAPHPGQGSFKMLTP